MEPQKDCQIRYHEREHYSTGFPRRADNSNPLVAWLNSYRIRTMLEIIGSPIAGKTILSICGGDGEEADFLQRLGAKVTMTDLSAKAVEAAHIRNSALPCLRMDAESLAFPDRSFDWAIVREGLHHLARPVRGLYELERVSREGFAFMEGQDSGFVRMLVKLGLGDNRDPGGGYVYRFSRREIRKIFSSIQTVAEWRIQTSWMPYGSDVLKNLPFFRRFVYPIINHPLLLRPLISRFGRTMLKGFYRLLNIMTGRWGNCLIVVAWKRLVPE